MAFDFGDPSSYYINPLQGGFTGALQGLAPYLGPQRAPVSPWAALAGALGGFGQGAQQAQSANLRGQLTQEQIGKLADERKQNEAWRNMFSPGGAGILGTQAGNVAPTLGTGGAPPGMDALAAQNFAADPGNAGQPPGILGGAQPRPGAAPASGPLAGLDPSIRPFIGAMGPERGGAFLSQFLAKNAETGQFVDEPKNINGIMVPGQTNKLTGAWKPLDPTTTKINIANSMVGPNEGSKEAYGLTAKSWQGMQQQVLGNAKTDAELTNFETAMGAFKPGATAETRLKAQQILGDLGIKFDNTSAGEVMQRAQRAIELGNTPKGQGAITENERVLIREANNLMGSSPEGAPLLISATRQLNNYDKQVERIYRESARKNGGAPNPVEVADGIEKLGPAIDPTLQAQIQAKAKAAAGTTGAAPASPAAPAAPQGQPPKLDAGPSGKAAYDALPSGSKFIAPDGTTRIKP